MFTRSNNFYYLRVCLFLSDPVFMLEIVDINPSLLAVLVKSRIYFLHLPGLGLAVLLVILNVMLTLPE